MENKDSEEIKKLAGLYNMIPNFIWSLLNLVPISIFCFKIVDLKIVYIFLAISFSPIFLKNSFLDKIQIGKTSSIYRKLGVHFINRVAQNGVLINKLIKRKFPDYKAVTNNKSSIAKLINQTYMFEKFHLMLFIFFSLIIIYAVLHQELLWSFIILLCNIVYNVYPNFLQQYIRLKLKLYSKREAESL